MCLLSRFGLEVPHEVRLAVDFKQFAQAAVVQDVVLAQRQLFAEELGDGLGNYFLGNTGAFTVIFHLLMRIANYRSVTNLSRRVALRLLRLLGSDSAGDVNELFTIGALLPGLRVCLLDVPHQSIDPACPKSTYTTRVLGTSAQV